MRIRLWIILSVAGLVMGCDFVKLKRDKVVALQTIDSLKRKLNENQKMAKAIVDVGTILDSIDASRNVLRANMVEGTRYDAYASRMRDLNRYVRNAQRRMKELEKAAKRNNGAVYAATIRKLRGELDGRNQELQSLRELVEKYKHDNGELISTVSLQRAEIDDKLNQLQIKQGEIDKLDAQVKELLTQAKIDEGEAYFRRAVAVEETARRTHFAPRKKKETRKEAVELYRLALFYGKEEAQAKIDELQGKH